MQKETQTVRVVFVLILTKIPKKLLFEHFPSTVLSPLKTITFLFFRQLHDGGNISCYHFIDEETESKRVPSHPVNY